MRKLFALGLFISFLFFGLARTEEVRVEGEAVSEPETVNPTGATTVIDVRSAAGQVSDVSEALDQSAGVTVKRYGGLGSYSVVMIRGASPNEISVFLDGVPLSGAASGMVNIGDLPLDALSRIEVYRGVAPVGFGGAPIGGVVNLVTRKAENGWMAGAAQSYGSFETYKTDLFGSISMKKWNALLFYNHLQSEGNFEYLDDNATPYNKRDDKEVERQNNDFFSDDFLIKGGWKPDARWEIFAMNEFFRKDSGLPGVGAFRVERASFSTLRNTSYVGARYLGSKVEFKPLAYYTYMEEEYRDPEGEIGVGTQENRYYSNTFGVNALGRFFFGNRAMLAVFAEGKNETYRERDLLKDDTGPLSSRVSLSGATQLELYLFDAKVILTPTLKVERYRSEFEGRSGMGYYLPASSSSADDTLFSPHFGLKVAPWESAAFTANVGKYYRVPTFIELFGDRGSIVGNPDLKAENGIHADAGAQINLKNRGILNYLNASYDFFYLDINDVIVMVQNSQTTSMSENISRAEIWGHELAVETVLADFFKAGVSYTFQVAMDRSGISYMDGNLLPGRPMNEISFRSAFFNKRWGEIFYTFDYMDGNYLDRAGKVELPSRRIHGAGVTVTPIEELSFTIEAKNIGDDRIYDVLGYPLPGRSYFGTVKYVYSTKNKKNQRSPEENEEGEN